MKQTKGILYIVLSATSFGVMPVLTKLAYAGGVSTYTVLFLRFGFAALMLLGYILSKGISLKLTRKQVLLSAALGAFGYSATALCLFSSYKYISSGLATNILYIYPAIVTVVSLFIYKERFHRAKAASLLLCIAGVFTMAGDTSSKIRPSGILLALLAAGFYSFYVLGTSHSEIKKISSYVMTFYVSITASAIMFIIGICLNEINFSVITPYSLICIVLVAFISTVVALMAFLEGVKLIGPSNASILSTLEPVVSLILGVVILRENFTFRIAGGCFMIILSVLILARKQDFNK